MSKKVVSHANALRWFRDIISLFQEKYQSSGHIGALDYGAGAQAGKSTYTGRTQVVRPTDSDFICDVELAVRKCLTPFEWAYFNKYYKLGVVIVLSHGDVKASRLDWCLKEHVERYPVNDRAMVTAFDERLRVKVGLELIARGLHQYSNYVGAEDVHGRRLSNTDLRKIRDRWSHLY